MLSIALIFNANIRDMFMIWNTNKYQVSQVTKEEIEENKETEGNFDFDSVKSTFLGGSPYQLNGIPKQLPVIRDCHSELEMNVPIFKGLDNVNLFYGAGTMKSQSGNGEGKLFSSKSPYICR